MHIYIYHIQESLTGDNVRWKWMNKDFGKKKFDNEQISQRLLIVTTDLDGFSLVNHWWFAKHSHYYVVYYIIHIYVYTGIYNYVIVKSHYDKVIVIITRVWGGAEDECINNDNLRVQWDLTGFYPIVFWCASRYAINDHWKITTWWLLWSLFCLREYLVMTDFTCCDVSKDQRKKRTYETFM